MEKLFVWSGWKMDFWHTQYLSACRRAIASWTLQQKGVIGCPLHGYKFDIKTGRSTDGNNYKIAHYQFKVEDDKMWIGWKSY